MDVDVIIPVQNHAGYLAAAIESVMQQQGIAQIIVVDAGSTDDSSAVATSFPQVTLLRSEISLNAAQARNRGLTRATAPLLAFLDADDIWLAHKIEQQRSALEQATKPTLLFASVEQFFSEELSAEEREKYDLDAAVTQGPHVGTLLCARTVFDRVGPFDESLDYGEFVDWFLRAKDMDIPYTVLPQLLMRRRIHRSNTGIVRRDDRSQVLRAVRDSLARRRQKSAAGEET